MYELELKIYKLCYIVIWLVISCTIILLNKNKGILMYEHKIVKLSGIGWKLIFLQLHFLQMTALNITHLYKPQSTELRHLSIMNECFI